MPKVYDLTADDIGYNGATKRDIGKKMVVWENGCVDIIKPYDQLLRCNIGWVIVAHGGAYSDHRHNANGDFVFYCDVLPGNAEQLFPQATVTRRGDYTLRTQIIFPKNTRLIVKRTSWKGVAL